VLYRTGEAKSSSPQAFTLTEMMVVIVLVGVLAAIALPIYNRYILQTKASEAKAVIGAIVAAEKAYAERNGVFLPVRKGDAAEFMNKLRVDVKESSLFDFEVSEVSGKDAFTVWAWVNGNGVKEGFSSSGYVKYTYRKSEEPRGKWEEKLW
jgi:prepilin-type N-terminal cleavage/methylation domain-containing protein